MIQFWVVCQIEGQIGYQEFNKLLLGGRGETHCCPTTTAAVLLGIYKSCNRLIWERLGTTVSKAMVPKLSQTQAAAMIIHCYWFWDRHRACLTLLGFLVCCLLILTTTFYAYLFRNKSHWLSQWDLYQSVHRISKGGKKRVVVLHKSFLALSGDMRLT